MDSNKSHDFDWLKTADTKLNEIELEDIQLDSGVQQNIYKTIAQMLAIEKPYDEARIRGMLPIGDITCKGFWVENTKELVLYVWVGDQSRAIVVPRDGWSIREDITIH
ncbi:hypothetical protein PITCH_A330003 [uncultured Desulfobacterium sp.]|uniref:Uncharacterized protein n=1 Tax=uncultured Desulfobacterium sp. TaxID=201089 RepID=A0A445MZ29_9BACT|nr:hypothetical protein PITCH_A330003 [uncultured Desulfobacterium sp.]